MKRFDVLYSIVNFGRNEERRLIKEGKTHEAYQIEHARNKLIYYFDGHTIKELLERIKEMVTFTIAKDGHWIYNVKCFVSDEFTRELLKDLQRII